VDLIKHWNKKYLRGDHINDQPLPLLVEFASRRTPGRALDLACGAGRHAIWLAEHGWQVTAVDFSQNAIAILHERAKEKGLHIDTQIADLGRHEFSIEPAFWDLIVDCNYLQRDLFPSIKEGIRINGFVLAVIAMVDHDPDVKPMNPEYLLQPGELKGLFAGWERTHYFEGKSPGDHRRAQAEIIARKVASFVSSA
jgi:tellurite methyltransferase